MGQQKGDEPQFNPVKTGRKQKGASGYAGDNVGIHDRDIVNRQHKTARGFFHVIDPDGGDGSEDSGKHRRQGGDAQVM
jgi:hypothetical protein